MKTFLLILIATLPAFSESPYVVEDIPLPEGIPPEVGGLDFAPDGTLFIVLRRGDVFRAKPKADSTELDWRFFATGFHNGCGIHAMSADRIRVTQMAEFTEAVDTDGSGTADRYLNFSSGWGLSGNYHETNTLAEDGKGGYYLSIGTASFNGPTFEHTLGEYSKEGRRGRNFSAVKWRGWVLHCDPEGRVTPFASGFRMHNGLMVDGDGELWSADNQGDWKAATPLYHVEKGKFYGHPSSLVWDPDWPADKSPLNTFRDDLGAYNKHRTLPAVEIPHGEMNRSGSEPIVIPEGFPHFSGQMLLPDNNGTRITRIMLEKIDGAYQGACTHFINGEGLRSGNNRVRFSPDGRQLYVGQTVRGWGKLAEGLQRITPRKDQVPFDVETVTVRPDGFRVGLTATPKEIGAGFEASSFTYQSKWTYGAPMENRKKHGVTVSDLSGSTVSLKVEGIEAGRVYELKLPDLKTAAGEGIRNRLGYYTANRLPKGD